MLVNVTPRLRASATSDNVVNSELDGKALITMGKSLNKPLLTLLGRTFLKMKGNIEKEIGNAEEKLQGEMKDLSDVTAKKRETLKTELCRHKICKEWSEWSACSASVRSAFGASKRSRTCGGSSDLCTSHSAENVEVDSKICQGSQCKSDYTLTTNQFCIRLSNTKVKSWTDAQEECHQDGGYLLNIDSELKARDVNETLEKMSFTTDLWIDGTRTLPNGEWIYEYGSVGFLNWKSTEPGLTDDCRAYVLTSNIRYWYGRSCTNRYYFLCEII